MKISIIIPSHNEASQLPKLISELRRRAVHSNNIEYIVAANDSQDATSAQATALGAIVTHSIAQRAAAMNSGAAVATGDILYFLHNDSIPPHHFDAIITDSFKKGRRAGCFWLAFDDSHILLRFVGLMSRLPFSWVHYGDQSLYVETSLFHTIGGFDEELSVMEDLNIVHRLKKRTSFAVMGPPIITSARKYRKYGYLKLQLLFIVLVLLYGIGVKQMTLLTIYQRHTS